MNNLVKTFSLLAITSASLLILAGCEESQISAPVQPLPVGQKPLPDPIADQPGSPQIPTDPGQPQPQTPGSPVDPGDPPLSEPRETDLVTGPLIPGAIRKIAWSALDFKTFQYDTRGQLEKYVSQYNYVQGSTAVKRDEYSYAYDNSGKLKQILSTRGERTEFSYLNGDISEAIAYDRLNRPLSRMTYRFNAHNRLVEYIEYSLNLNGTEFPKAKTTFDYSPQGNLTVYRYFTYSENAGGFLKSIEIRYSNFDNKRYSKNSISFAYQLQNLDFFVNNPGKREVVGTSSPVETYSYVYDQDGFPASRKTSFIYEKPLPALEAEFIY